MILVCFGLVRKGFEFSFFLRSCTRHQTRHEGTGRLQQTTIPIKTKGVILKGAKQNIFTTSPLFAARRGGLGKNIFHVDSD